MMRGVFRAPAAAALLAAMAGCSAGSSPAPRSTPAPTIAFDPATVTVHSSSYDLFGDLVFTAAGNGVPKPIDPPDGTLACDGGYRVNLQVRSGPVALGLVRDQYVVLPLLTTIPTNTATLTCTSEWGLYSASGTLLASTTLDATVIYDAGPPAIAFHPASATIKAKGSNPQITLAYTSASGFKVKATSPADGTLACPDGYAPKTQLRAGPLTNGELEDEFKVKTSSISPPAGTTLACSVTYGLFDASKDLVAQATLDVTLDY